MQDVQGYATACQVLQRNLSARAKRLQKLEKYVDGTQYDGLPDWFSDVKPLWERAPCIVYPIVKSAIDSNGDLLLGDGRFPVVTVAGLNGSEADNFEKAIASLIQQSRLRAAAREIFAAGQGCGSACAVFGLRGGRLFIDTVLAHWCTPTLTPEGAVVELEIRYPYLATIQVGAEQRAVCLLYRRVVTDTKDITYKPVEASPDGLEPTWTEAESISHGLGFCPVVWYAHLRGCAAVNDYDGRAIHEHLTDEIRAHDFALSQRHRAALYAGDPQWTEIGVSPGYNPTSAGRKADVPASATGRPGEMPHAAYVSGPATPKARKKSPGTVWQYESKETKVHLHALPGDALKALDDHARDLRTKLAESLGVVFLDAESLPNESRLSGRALESLKARQLDRVDYYRSDFGDRFLIPALGMLLRIALGRLDIEGFDVVERVVAQQPQWSWHAPPLHFMWGDYFRPSGEEEELLIRAAVQAKDGGLATTRILVEKLRSVLGVKDVDAYMVELEAEKAEALKQAQEMAKAAAAPQKATQRNTKDGADEAA